MKNKISVNSNLESKIRTLMVEKEKINIFFEAINKLIDDLPNGFDGKVGKESYNRLDSYRKKFEKIINALDVRIEFLSKTLLAYEKADEMILKAADNYL